MSTLIIAEAGVNHNGCVEIAKKLVELAANAGADAVKFQTFKTENLVTKTVSMAPYQKNNINTNETQFEMLKKLELTHEDHHILRQECAKFKIRFLSTAFDLDSVNFLNSMGLDTFKIPSGEITNYPLLRRIGTLNKKVIFSIGLAEIEEVEYCFNTLIESGTRRENITILQCTTEYPAPDSDVNLLVMKELQRKFQVKVGLSDHSIGITMPIAAVALGASVIEKHFTLDRNMEGPDHKASLNPEELKSMVSEIRRVEKGLGSGIKTLMPSEIKNKDVARKSLVAKRTINPGEVFTEDNLTTKRPGNGLSPMLWQELIGQKAKMKYNLDELILKEELL